MEDALTHRSFRFENEGVESDNQRLEFLGDAVLGFITAFHVYQEHENEQEGFLTSFRSQITSGKALAKLALEIDLGKYIKIGKGEEQSGGRKRSSTLTDALEAVIGAAYLDGGIKAVQKIFSKLFMPYAESLDDDIAYVNPKGKLQEYSQRAWKTSPHYRIIKKEGPPHETIFTAEVILRSGLTGVGKARNKQEAEARAAREALRRLEARI